MANSERREVRQALMTGIRWLAAARLLAQTSNWVITLIVIRLLTPGDYGLQAMVAVFYTLLLLLSQSGYDRAIASYSDFGRAELRQILGFGLATNILVMIAVWSVAPYIAAYYQEEMVVPLLRVLAVGFVLSVFKTIPVGVVWRNMDYRSHALASLIGTVSASFTTLILAVLGHGVWALITGMLVMPTATAIYLQYKTRWLVMPSFALAGIGALIKNSWTISLSFFVWSFAWRMDILIGGQQLSAAELGFYVVAFRLCALPLAKVVPLANEILYPAYAKLQKDSSAVNVYFDKALASLCFVLFPVFLGLAAITEWAVPVVFGARWSGIEPVMMIVALAMPFRVVAAMCNPLLQATGNAMTSLATGIGAVVLIAACVLAGVRWGVIGLALAVLTATPVVMSIVVAWTRESSGLTFRSLVGSVGPTLAISVVMAIIVYWVGTVTTDWLPDAAVVGLQIVCGAIIYTAIAAAFTRELLLSTVSIIRTSAKSRGKKPGQKKSGQ